MYDHNASLQKLDSIMYQICFCFWNTKNVQGRHYNEYAMHTNCYGCRDKHFFFIDVVIFWFIIFRSLVLVVMYDLLTEKYF